MSWNQRAILLAGLLTFVGVGLYPPWQIAPRDKRDAGRTPVGHYLLFEPPSRYVSYSYYEIDMVRLGILWLLTVVATAGAFGVTGHLDSPKLLVKFAATDPAADSKGRI
jgi:hypothetical protein